MTKLRTTLTIDEEVFRAVRIKAARTGKRDSQVIEESLRRDLGLDHLEDVWARVELRAVLGREKFRRYIDLASVDKYVDRLKGDATVVADPKDRGPLRASDPADDYLIDLAFSQKAIPVSGDKHLRALCGNGAPILAPRDLLAAVA
jgi:predicted nucleic acid-binding protein